MALGHSFRRRGEFWILSLAAWVLWWLWAYTSLGPREHQHSILISARGQIENMLLVYDCGLRKEPVSGVPEWLRWKPDPDEIVRIIAGLEKDSLISDALWVDAALVYHHFAGATGEAKWREKALAALARVHDRENGSYYFFQVDAAVRGQKLKEKDREKLVTLCEWWPADWWMAQLAVAHGMPEAVNQARLHAREQRAVRQQAAGGLLTGLLILAGVLLAWPAWRAFRRAAADSSMRKGDHARHLRRLWAGAPALLCFSLAAMLHLVVGKVFQVTGPLLLLGINKDDPQARLVVENGWWLLGAIASLLTWPAAMRWCMAPGCRSVFQVFDLRRAYFRDRRWWSFGITGTGLLFAALTAFTWGMKKAGVDGGVTDHFSRSFRALGSAEVPVMILLAVFLGPCVEELVYRGLLFTAMRNEFGPWLGAVISSAIFALGHLYGNVGTLTVFLSGLILCCVYQRSKSLAPGMILHGCINLSLLTLKWLQWSA